MAKDYSIRIDRPKDQPDHKHAYEFEAEFEVDIEIKGKSWIYRVRKWTCTGLGGKCLNPVWEDSVRLRMK